MEIDNGLGIGEEVDIEVLQLPIGQELVDRSGHVCALPKVVRDLEVLITWDKILAKLLGGDSLEGGLYPKTPPGP